jgi:hypothetical protein
MEILVVKRKDNRWHKPCFQCGKDQTYLRKNYAVQSLKLKKLCKSCSNKKTENSHRGWDRGIRISWFNKFKVSAETRGIHWDINIDDVANLMETQNYKCALSGLNILFPDFGHPSDGSMSASIDRINSKKGYVCGNIQLVDKRINMMKQQFSQEEFIKLCKLVGEKI